MPVVLVIVVTLVQENVLKSMGETKIRVLFLDRDLSEVGRQMEEIVRKSDAVTIVKEIAGKADRCRIGEAGRCKRQFSMCRRYTRGHDEGFYEKGAGGGGKLAVGKFREGESQKRTTPG